MKILITGAAGFIGFHTCKKFTEQEFDVLGLDSISDYYDVRLKYDRLKLLGISEENPVEEKKYQSQTHENFRFIKTELENKSIIDKIFKEEQFDIVINLAAQAGVGHSLKNPYQYINSNITGFLNILEACVRNNINHLIYASSSSVYGLNEKIPFSTTDRTDTPISMYAVSKKTNELMAHSYSHLYGIPVSGLRFFNVYGPWGRPDMALFLFTKAILENQPIKVFNNGKMLRDFTYIDDITEGIFRVTNHIPQKKSDGKAPFRIFNIGNNSPVLLTDFITAIEEELGTIAEKIYLPIQPGEVPTTFADVDDLVHEVNYKPATSVKTGIKNFIHWYRNYYSV